MTQNQDTQDTIDTSIGLDALKTGMEAPQFDPTPYIGELNVITDVSIHKGSFGRYIKVTGTSVAKLGDKDITPSAVFGLYEDEKTGEVGIATGSKLDKFLNVMGVNTPAELVGCQALLQTKQSKDGDKEFLTFRGA
jgi:hypothetical protein